MEIAAGLSEMMDSAEESQGGDGQGGRVSGREAAVVRGTKAVNDGARDGQEKPPEHDKPISHGFRRMQVVEVSSEDSDTDSDDENGGASTYAGQGRMQDHRLVSKIFLRPKTSSSRMAGLKSKVEDGKRTCGMLIV